MDYTHALLKAFSTNDTNSAEIRATSTGGQLTLLIESMIKNKGLGHVAKGTLPTNATIKSIAPDHKSAVLTVCNDTKAWRAYDVTTGQAVPGSLGIYESDTTFVWVDGAWKVSKSVIRGATSC